MPALCRGFGYGTRASASTLGARFLIDNALPPRLAELLFAAGHDAVHIRRYGMQASIDEDVLARASEENLVIVSAVQIWRLLAERRMHGLSRDADSEFVNSQSKNNA